MSTFWLIFIFLYFYGLVTMIWRRAWWAAFGVKCDNPLKYYPLGLLLMLIITLTIAWAAINYGITHLFIWWIGV